MRGIKKAIPLAILCFIGNACSTNVTVFAFKINVNEFRIPSAVSGFTGSFKTELSKIQGIQLLERENLSAITSEIALSQSGLLSGNKATHDSTDFQGVDFAIGGEITQMSHNRYRVDLAIRKVRSAKIIGERISGNMASYGDEMACMLAQNVTFLITGKGSPISKKVIRRKGAIGLTLVSLCGVAAGALIRQKGLDEYEIYKTYSGTLQGIDDQYQRASIMTRGGEIGLGICSGTAVVGFFRSIGGKKGRTITRE